MRNLLLAGVFVFPFFPKYHAPEITPRTTYTILLELQHVRENGKSPEVRRLAHQTLLVAQQLNDEMVREYQREQRNKIIWESDGGISLPDE